MAGNVLYDTFGKIEGLNVEEGLSHLMNMESIYIKIMKKSVDNLKEQLAKIRENYQTLPPAEMKIYYHSMKGIFANIAMEALRAQSFELEQAATAENSAYLQENTPAYLKAIEDFLAQLLQAIESYEKSVG